MSSQQDELAAARAEGIPIRVPDNRQTSPSSPRQGAALQAMMLEAAEKGKVDVVRQCLARGAEVSYRVITAATGSDEVFKLLVTEGGLDVNYDLETGGDMLINAVWERNRDFTRWLLEHGADPNSGHLMADSTSAITAAAEQGRLDLAELLVQHGAKVSGSGALAAAAERGHIDMVSWLLDQGADIDETGVHDYGISKWKERMGTALHKAVVRGDVAMAKVLVHRGAKTDMEDLLGRTPLMRAREENQQFARAWRLPGSPTFQLEPVYRAHEEVRVVFFSVWGVVALGLVWALVFILVIRHFQLVDGMYYGRSWAFFPVIPKSVDLRSAQWDGNSDMSGTMTLAVPWKVIGEFGWQNTKYPYFSFSSFCWAYAIVCLFQAVMTLSLHCAELMVNVVRDEKTWRRAGNRSGGLKGEPGLSRAPTNALHALFVSGPGLTLFLYKPILHWIFGLAVSTYFSVGLVMHPPQIIYLSLEAVLLAFFVSACAFWQPKGPQPATFGHLQTLVDLIDEWPEVGEPMFWGRKEGEAVESGSNKNGVQADISALRDEVLEEDLLNTRSIAHAGTAATMLEEVRYDEAYMSNRII